MSSSPPLNLRAVASSRLLGVSNRHVVAAHARSLELAILRVRDLDWTRDAVIVHRAGAYLSPVARRFIAAIEAAGNGVDFGFQTDNLVSVPPVQLTQFVEKLRSSGNG